jgi:TolB protein
MRFRSMLVLLALGTLGCGGASAATSADSTSGAKSSTRADAGGSMIAYNCGETPDICVMQPDGSGVRRLASDPANDEDPGWSPDGRRIVFASSRNDRGTGRNQIYIMNADGSGVEQVTRDAGGKFEPDWSPDGTKLAFVGDRGGNFDIYVMNVDGSGVTNLTNSPASESDPAWSPNGQGILYTVDARFPELWVMNSSGGDAQKLGSGLAADWSPVGSRIAFSPPTGGIAVLSLQDVSVTRLTRNPYDLEPTWSPDGARIIFRRGRVAENADLYSVPSDGGRLTRLTDDLAPETLPDWSPVMR